MKNIYFLKWQDHTLILPETDEQSLIKDFEEENVKLVYGGRFEEEDLESLRMEMKVRIEKSVNRWINDSRFVIHLLMAAGVFLVSYYFLSYVVRDPLPLIDEIVLSVIIGILAWYRLNNQQYQSDKVIQKKLEMEQLLHSLPGESSDFVTQVELYLEKLATMSGEEQNNLNDSGAVPVFFTSEKKDLVKLFRVLSKTEKRVAPFKKTGLPFEMKALQKQIRSFLKYHSSMV